MTKSTLIKKTKMSCPVCDVTHEIELRKGFETTVFKGEEITFERTYYYCSNANEDENEFEDGQMTNKNLLNARNAYRVKKGLLTSNEIVAIRESYGISQVELAKLLGWGEATISRYESKAIQDESYDALLRLIRDNPLKALDLLKKNADKFQESKISKIRNNMVERLNSYGKEFMARQIFEGEYANFDEPSIYNGFTKLNIDKIEAIISYFAKANNDLVKAKLMKLLWYSDWLSYSQRGKTITGLVYRRELAGVMPIGHFLIFNLDKVNAQEEMDSNYETRVHIYPDAKIDYSILTNDEILILDTVSTKYKNCNIRALVEYTEKELAHINAKPGDIVPFDMIKEAVKWKQESI